MAASILASAQEPISVTIHSVDDSAFPNVSAILTADRGGRPVLDIALPDLEVQESGAPGLAVSIQRAADAGVPLAVVVTLDASGSMEEGDTLTKAKDAAAALVNRLSPIDQVGVVSFSDEVRIAQQMGADRGAAIAAIGRVQIENATNLYDAVVDSQRLVATSTITRRAVILLTDGTDSIEDHRFGRDESLALAERSGTPFYVVGVGTDLDRPYLEDLARRSRGRYFHAAGRADVPDVYAEIEGALRSQFVVTIRSNAPSAIQDRFLTIEVDQRGAAGSARFDYRSNRSPPRADSGPFSNALVWAGGVGLIAGIAGVVVMRRRRRRLPVGGRLGSDAELIQPGAVPAEQQGLALLALVRAPAGERDAGGGGPRRLQVGDVPVVIGWGDACGIRFAKTPDVAAEHARVWLRDGRLMIHHIASGQATVVADQTVTWASLSKNDEISIGPYSLRYLGTTDEQPAGSS
jgi:hypothetical protein